MPLVADWLKFSRKAEPVMLRSAKSTSSATSRFKSN